MGYLNKVDHRSQDVDKAGMHEEEKSAGKQEEAWENVCDGATAVCVICGWITVVRDLGTRRILTVIL